MGGVLSEDVVGEGGQLGEWLTSSWLFSFIGHSGQQEHCILQPVSH